MSEKTLPKGITQEEFDKAKTIIVSGFEANQEPDVIKTAMFSDGIPFSNLMRLYKAVTVSEGLVISSTKIREGIVEELEEYKFTEDMDYDAIDEIIAAVVEAVSGATPKKVTAQIKNVMESQDLEMPRKPRKKKGKRTSKINAALIDLFAENTEATVEEFQAKLEEVTTEKSAKKWMRLYKTMSAIANGLDSVEGLK